MLNSLGSKSSVPLPVLGRDSLVLHVDDPIKTVDWPVFGSLLQQLRQVPSCIGPVSRDVLLVGLCESLFVLLVHILSQLVDVLVFLEFVPGCGFTSVELLVKSSPHFITNCFLLANWYFCQWVL